MDPFASLNFILSIDRSSPVTLEKVEQTLGKANDVSKDAYIVVGELQT